MKEHSQKQLTGNRIRWFRLGLVGLVVLWFVWIGIEDTGLFTVLLMAAALLIAAAVAVYMRQNERLPQSGKQRFAAILLIGLASGTLITPTAVLLMAIKISLHNHIVPDFTRRDITAVLESTPAWVLGALLLSSAGALYDRARSD
jgi:hypothetical protein